ncbi:hypothetical protein EVAR_81998_1 [Eumeta japonica]|uniref:Uncharacterized protein n=1 Tax=Eumeta variegata TaxID=151549 RepID=A0A4C1VTV6_EUMVA|nr:hypothetical protein EVAR_81998_1 [Eumeta japonica]
MICTETSTVAHDEGVADQHYDIEQHEQVDLFRNHQRCFRDTLYRCGSRVANAVAIDMTTMSGTGNLISDEERALCGDANLSRLYLALLWQDSQNFRIIVNVAVSNCCLERTVAHNALWLPIPYELQRDDGIGGAKREHGWKQRHRQRDSREALKAVRLL